MEIIQKYIFQLLEMEETKLKCINLGANDNERVKVELDMINKAKKLLEKQKAEIETLKRDFEIVDHECSRLEQEDIRKDKIINGMVNFIKCLDIDFTDICNTRMVRQCDGPQCKDCIIKNIENKVKESKQYGRVRRRKL